MFTKRRVAANQTERKKIPERAESCASVFSKMTGRWETWETCTPRRKNSPGRPADVPTGGSKHGQVGPYKTMQHTSPNTMTCENQTPLIITQTLDSSYGLRSHRCNYKTVSQAAEYKNRHIRGDSQLLRIIINVVSCAHALKLKYVQ